MIFPLTFLAVFAVVWVVVMSWSLNSAGRGLRASDIARDRGVLPVDGRKEILFAGTVRGFRSSDRVHLFEYRGGRSAIQPVSGSGPVVEGVLQSIQVRPRMMHPLVTISIMAQTPHGVRSRVYRGHALPEAAKELRMIGKSL